MSAVVSKAATRRLALPSTSTAPIIPIALQKKRLSTTAKRALPLYFYSDHSPSPSTPAASTSKAAGSTTLSAAAPDRVYHAHHHHGGSGGVASLHSLSGDFSQTQHAFDPPSTAFSNASNRAAFSSSSSAAASSKSKAKEKDVEGHERVYRPEVEEYDYMAGSASYGHESGVRINLK